MKMKKIDLSGLKDFLFQKGERVGLVICGGIALLLLALGLMKVGNASTSYAEDYKKLRTPLEKRLGGVPHEEKVEVPNPSPPWDPVKPWFPDNSPLAPFPDSLDIKARNPEILPIPDDPEHMKVEYYRGGVFTYELGKNEISLYKGGDKIKKPIQNMEPVRMIVVTAVFPMKLQWEEYHRQLNYIQQVELDKEDRPKPLGLIVHRREIKADGKGTDWEPLYWLNDEKVEVADRLKTFFQKVFFETDNLEALKNHLMRGLETPLPKLANISYSKMALKDIKEIPLPPGVIAIPPPQGQKNPQGAVPVVETEKITFEKLKEFETNMAAQVMGKMDFFEASGVLEIQDGPVKTGQQRLGKYRLMRMPGGLAPPPLPPIVPGQKEEVFEKLIRFIDVGVEPGKTYEYTFRVRFANPNFGKREEVSYEDLASIKELISPDAYTQPITIPEEFFYYAADQKIDPALRISGGADAEAARAEPPLAYGLWNTPLQIHKWVDKIEATTVADWAIGERLLVRRGDTIGRLGVMVEVPVWDNKYQKFKIGFEPQARDSKSKKQAPHTGLLINFIRDNPPPLLIDFEGGWKNNVRIGKANIAKDESAVEMLILTSEGKLTVRNSRFDTDSDSPVGMERHERWDTWYNSVKRLRNAGVRTGAGSGLNMPGGIQMPGKN